MEHDDKEESAIGKASFGWQVHQDAGGAVGTRDVADWIIWAWVYFESEDVKELDYYYTG